MDFIISLLVNAGVILLLAKYMNTIHVKDYMNALLVALVIGLLNATIGAILRFPLNLVTLFLLQAVIRIVVTAIMVKLASNLFKDFKVDGWGPAFIVAIAMAVAGALTDSLLLN